MSKSIYSDELRNQYKIQQKILKNTKYFMDDWCNYYSFWIGYESSVGRDNEDFHWFWEI